MQEKSVLKVSSYSLLSNHALVRITYQLKLIASFLFVFGGFCVNCSYFRLDIIVIGTGDKVVRLPEEIHREMRKNQVALEVQDTVSFNSCFIMTIHSY